MTVVIKLLPRVHIPVTLSLCLRVVTGALRIHKRYLPTLTLRHYYTERLTDVQETFGAETDSLVWCSIGLTTIRL